MKKIIAFLLSVLMVFSVTVCAYGQGNTAVVDGVVPSSESKYYYRDSYFSIDASEYLPSLSTMSFWLAESGSASGKGENQSCNARELLGQIGFDKFEVNKDFTTVPGTDTMGVAMAYKTIDLNGVKSTLLAIVPRSTNYGAEWAGNFTLGASGEAAGFSTAAKTIENFAKEYVAKYSKNFYDNLKVWIVGYSRGAAVANLVAGHFSESQKIGTVSVNKENIYAYTFETPAGANTSTVSLSKARSFTNIHNIISSNDLVTKVAPKDWNFIRYGTDEEIIPETRTSSNTKLFDTALTFLPDSFATVDENGKRIFATEKFQAKKLNVSISTLSKLGSWKKVNGSYVWDGVDFNTAIKMITKNSTKTMSDVWSDTFTVLTIGVGSRKNYTNKLQKPLRLLLSETLGGKYSSDTFTIVKSVLSSQINEKKTDILMAALSGKKSYLSSILQDIINDVVSKCGLDSSVYGDLGEELVDAIPLAVNAILADVTLYGGTEIFSLLENISIMFNPHYPAQCRSWLQAMDINYNPNVDAGKVTGVGVDISQTKTVKKILFIKTTVTKNNVSISPTSDLPVQNVAWRTSKLSSWTTGSTFSTTSSIGHIYIRITDSEGRITYWDYYKGTTKKTN